MTYNIHPILVHFPIALLFLYSAVKILPLDKFSPDVSWKHIERIFLVVGVMGALAAYSTGDIARRMVEPTKALVRAHSNFAFLSILIFGLLFFGEAVCVVRSRYGNNRQIQSIQPLLVVIENVLCHPVFSRVLAFCGFVSITLTGMLGGAMVYGLTADPLTAPVLKLLGISL